MHRAPPANSRRPRRSCLGARESRAPAACRPPVKDFQPGAEPSRAVTPRTGTRRIGSSRKRSQARRLCTRSLARSCSWFRHRPESSLCGGCKRAPSRARRRFLLRWANTRALHCRSCNQRRSRALCYTPGTSASGGAESPPEDEPAEPLPAMAPLPALPMSPTDWFMLGLPRSKGALAPAARGDGGRSPGFVLPR